MVLGFRWYSIHGSVRLRIEAPEEKSYLTRWWYTDPGETRKHADNGSGSIYTFESKARGTSKGRGKRH